MAESTAAKIAEQTLEAAEETLVRAMKPLAVRMRQAVGAAVVDNFFRATAHTAKWLPIAHPRLHGVEVIRNVRYLDGRDRSHTLDIYRPRKREGKVPIVLYIHGGGFRILSKDSHWLFGLVFARRGYLVLNVGYRLAPKHPFPAAIQDVCAAYEWLVKHAEEYGGDLDRIVLAGESAGANLATALTLATTFERVEPWARKVFDLGVVPKAVIPACGMLQVSDPERYIRRKRLPVWVSDRLVEVADAYLKGVKVRHPRELDLCDPVCLLERDVVSERPLPPFFTFVGTADPLLDDTRRLKVALERRRVRCDVRYYPGEMHAFHAFVFRGNARSCWKESFAFLDQNVGKPPPPEA
jgi:acetyl esterase